MQRFVKAVAAAGMVVGSLAGAGAANAAQVTTTTNTTPVAPHTTPVPIITALGCFGGTGLDGCGPGWIWRDGWRGFGCYVC